MARGATTTVRDVYADLLRDTRGLRREHANARDRWYANLPWDRKEESLFELEMLLKGFACFGNPRNHPGPIRTSPGVVHDHREELRIVRDALEEAIAHVKALLGQKEKAFVFSRYLETVLPEDAERNRLVQDQLSQDTPEESLFVIRNAFAGSLEISDGLLRLGRISHRLYAGCIGTITREVARNVYFNPLATLEFRPEFDRIRNTRVLETLHGIENDAAHRIAALTFLGLFRVLRYVSLLEEYAARPEIARRAYVILAVLRSDVRALVRYLTLRSGDVLANGLEREILDTNAADIRGRYDELVRESRELGSLRATLVSLANAYRVEIRRVFERDLVAPEFAIADDELQAKLLAAAKSIRGATQHAIATLCRELDPSGRVPQLADDDVTRAASSERLRRDVWMFAQVLRAFLAKAHATQVDPDRWAGLAGFHFVREFLGHFRAIGYQLLRYSEYEHFNRFLTAIESLRDIDLLDPDKLDRAVLECADFQVFLEDLFVRVSRRAELRGVPFDKRAAAETLKIYLGAA